MDSISPSLELRPPVSTQLIVFADDWGRHPSSSQHLVRELLPHYKVLWVNTVGTRRPRLSLGDLKRALGVVGSWFGASKKRDEQSLPEGLAVISPKMYPGYRRGWQRRFNAKQVGKAIQANLLPGHRYVGVTTLPTTADLVGVSELPGRAWVDRWVYYCVDDYSQWPGTDHAVMDAMERELVGKVDTAVCVSEVLRERVVEMLSYQRQDTKTPRRQENSDPKLLSHGVNLKMWQTPRVDSVISKQWPDDRKPIALFWGLVDERMDEEWCEVLCDEGACKVVFAGPSHADLMFLLDVDSLHIGPIPHADLPAHAAAASVLIMPYIDAPVTRAMQPLKLLEYLATMKPVVVRDLPSTRVWADCCDVVGSAEDFARIVALRAQTGTPPEQVEARKRRLAGESWAAKAGELARVINAGD